MPSSRPLSSEVEKVEFAEQLMNITIVGDNSPTNGSALEPVSTSVLEGTTCKVLFLNGGSVLEGVIAVGRDLFVVKKIGRARKQKRVCTLKAAC